MHFLVLIEYTGIIILCVALEQDMDFFSLRYEVTWVEVDAHCGHIKFLHKD